MECEIKLAWIKGYIQSVFDRTTLTRDDWTKVEKLARKAWRNKCENLAWENPPASDPGEFDVKLAA